MDRVAPLHIRTAPGQNYLVRLYDAESNRMVLSVFVHGGQLETVMVPIGSFTVKFASGSQWYGYWQLFGPDTVYTKAERIMTFTGSNSWEVTLYAVSNGNMHLTPISADQF
jgi:hypothetical protein